MLGNPWIEVCQVYISCSLINLPVLYFCRHDLSGADNNVALCPLRPHLVLRWSCLPAQRFCRSFSSIFTQMSLPPLKVSSQVILTDTHFELVFFNDVVLSEFAYTVKKPPETGLIILSPCLTEALNVEFVCNVLVVADQLLITRLKEMCEVAVTENCMRCIVFFLCPSLPLSFSCFLYHEIMLHKKITSWWMYTSLVIKTLTGVFCKTWITPDFKMTCSHFLFYFIFLLFYVEYFYF